MMGDLIVGQSDEEGMGQDLNENDSHLDSGSCKVRAIIEGGIGGQGGSFYVHSIPKIYVAEILELGRLSSRP